MIGEFKPALIFLAKFLAVYILGNLLYGFFIEAYDNVPDPITRVVTIQSAKVLDAIGYDASTEDHPSAAKVMLKNESLVVINVFEGCNGINVIIVFMAFLIAYSKPTRQMLIFSIVGVLIIHIFNLGRIAYLFDLAFDNAKSFYYYHKYFFTASLYAVVFALWTLWVLRFAKKDSRASVS
jgi:exosortase family protein XrtF